MSATAKCSFCDSSEEKNRESIHNALIWDKVRGILLYYFPNFSYAHFQGLCNSCFEYVYKFSKHRTIWMKNEKLIQTKRQSGHFKGLKHLIKLKKSSSVVCRLCFKESCSEEVVFLYLDNNCYQPGYIQQIMNLHANDIDFKLTESPVVCQECLDVVQTFDALYQMSVENQGNKKIPDLILRNSKHLGGHVNKGEKNDVVHLQLKKNEDNSLVLRSVTENESAVRCLIKNKESDNIILNGWTVRKVLDLMQQPKHKALKSSLNQDAYVISDEETPIDQDSEPSDSKHESDEEIGISAITNEESISIVQPEDNSDRVDVVASNDIIEIGDSDEEQLEYPQIVEVASLQETHGDPHIFDEFDDEASYKMIDIDKADTRSNSLVHLDGETESDQESTSSSKRPHIQGTDNLEKDLSAFLLFNKDSRMNTEQHFLEGLQGTSCQTNDKSKKLKLSATIPFKHLPAQNDSKSFASAYDQFLKGSTTDSGKPTHRKKLFTI